MAITAFYLRAFALLGKPDVLAASRHSDLDLGLTCRMFVIKTGNEAFLCQEVIDTVGGIYLHGSLISR